MKAEKMEKTPEADPQKRDRRDLLIAVLLLLLGILCLLIAAQAAIMPGASWQASASMLSDINPDKDVTPINVRIERLREDASTPLPPDRILATDSNATPVPIAVAGQPVKDTATPSPTATPVAPTAEATAPPPTPLPTETSTTTPLPTPTATWPPTPTATGTLIPSATSTNTPLPPPPAKDTPVPSNTPPPPPPPTNTPTPTETALPTPTNTSTPTPTNTPIPTNTATPTETAIPAPVVLDITPDMQVNTADVGVTITGQSFQAGCSAVLEGVTLPVTYHLSTAISATVPMSLTAGVYDLTVTNPDSQSDTLTNAYTAINPVPTVTSIDSTLISNDADQTVTITGGNFRNTGTPGSLQVNLGGTPLTNVTLVNESTLTAVVPAGTAVGEYNPITVINPGPTSPSGSLADTVTIYAYATDVNCDSGVGDCSSASGDPDGNYAQVDSGETLTISLGIGNGITDGPGYDMVFYERPFGGGIQLDHVTIEIGDGSNWYTVFEWNGDSGTATDVSGTNIDSYASDSDGELDNEPIPSGDLYPRSSTPNTGIAIDIGAVSVSVPPGSYHLVRISNPGGSQDAEVDAITRLN